MEVRLQRQALRLVSRRDMLHLLLLGFGCLTGGSLGRSSVLTKDEESTSQDAITFDAEPLLRMLRWAEGNDSSLPSWRNLSAYELARQQAQWSGQPDHDQYVERQLALMQAEKQQHREMPQIKLAANLLRQVIKERQHFLSWAVPHLRTYLPAGTPIRGTISLAAFLRNYAFSMNGTIVVSLTDAFWQQSAARVFNLLLHELFHNGFVARQPSESPENAHDGRISLRAFFWSLQNEGMATYVAYKRSSGLDLKDYKLLQEPDEVRNRMRLCHMFIGDTQDCSPSAIPALRDRFWRLGSEERVTYVVGAAMAERIEQVSGRIRLVNSVEKGSEDFVNAYRETQPALDL